MTYYIDFEATQYGHHMISISLLDEDGNIIINSYSRCPNKDKLTPFITELTGITQSDLAAAPDYDEIFNKLADYFFSRERPEAICCYGDFDKIILHKCFNHTYTSKAQACILFMESYLLDVSKKLFDTFNITGMKLQTMYEAIQAPEHLTAHNSLSDAKMLRYINQYPIDEAAITRVREAAGSKLKAEKVPAKVVDNICDEGRYYLEHWGILTEDNKWNVETKGTPDNYGVAIRSLRRDDPYRDNKILYFEDIVEAAWWYGLTCIAPAGKRAPYSEKAGRDYRKQLKRYVNSSEPVYKMAVYRSSKADYWEKKLQTKYRLIKR